MSVVGAGDAVEVVESAQAVFDQDLAEYNSGAWIVDD